MEEELRRGVVELGRAHRPDDRHFIDDPGEAGEEPDLTAAKGTLKETMEATEKTIIVRALEETGGNQTQAAAILGITPQGLNRILREAGSELH